jgi:hypothetical protein
LRGRQRRGWARKKLQITAAALETPGGASATAPTKAVVAASIDDQRCFIRFTLHDECDAMVNRTFEQ